MGDEQPVVKVKQKAKLQFGNARVSGFKDAKKETEKKRPVEKQEAKTEEPQSKMSKQDRKDKGLQKLRERESEGTREILVQAAKTSQLSVPMSKRVRAEYVVCGSAFSEKFQYKYLLALTDTGSQKSKMRTIPFGGRKIQVSELL